MRAPKFMMPSESAFGPQEALQVNDLAMGQAEIANQITAKLFPDPEAQSVEVTPAAIHELVRSAIESMSASGLLYTTPEGMQALQAESIIELTRDVFLDSTKGRMVDADTTEQLSRQRASELVAKIFGLANASNRINHDYKHQVKSAEEE